MSILSKLLSRETGSIPDDYSFYSDIYPNKTAFSLQETCFINRFSPCGQYLITFSDQNCIKIYKYLPKINKAPQETLDFDDFFTKLYKKNLTAGKDMLLKEFCLFTEYGNQMIIASAFPSFLNVNLDDITFRVVEIETGTVLDKITYQSDYIYLNNHTGVHLYQKLFAVTSVHNQSIYINMIKVFFQTNSV